MSTPRYQINTSVNQELKDRIEALQKKGYSVPEIIIKGVELLEGERNAKA